ncbi:uroporphyrinogen decarboxylase family protein [Desulfosporosinus sp. PR]|uniref:uroporphyrinogen decarboxylase family protein n=1 Tax=Candidatus Desulfosporosinus nitrosoreducens TaxID=3401928 RepID=UPI0027ED78D1|nr:uroporphyrinogen decarboxylase family protein [Desulfosporosinus sp. PR]MDQ7093573.1 uroporphyrinogen decarboxylase family protein [Desulfosporosinus sp. PR]
MSNSLLLEREARITQALALEKPDRVPVVALYTSFAARVTKTPLSEFVKSSFTAARVMIEAADMIGGFDGIDYGSFFPSALSLLWLSKVKLPGVELPADAGWQVHEQELMKQEDYERIINEGWPNWLGQYLTERISPTILQDVMADAQDTPEIFDLWNAKGIPVLGGVMATIPFEILCGARSFAKFVRDLYKMPDKVEAAMAAMMPFMTKQALETTKQIGKKYMWVGGWRAAGSMLSQPLWDRFVFPYMEKVINEVIEAGVTPILHFDSDWGRDLARFKVLPKGKCIFAPDGMTDIYKAKEILGDTMCIMGDVPPSMLSLGTPDEVYKYSRKLIEELGPTGFILHSGCDIPIDAKLENVQAMVAAATGK